jgi:hypothetical protein
MNMMNTKDNRENTAQAIVIEDLNVQNGEEIKGGDLPKVPAYSIVIDRRPAL